MNKTDREKPVRQVPSRPPAFAGEALRTIKQDVLDWVVGAGLHALEMQLEADRVALCGPRYRHRPERDASRSGYAPSEIVLGGRRVSLRRPRVRNAEGEVELPSWRMCVDDDPLFGRAVEQMVLGVSTRHYARSLERLTEGERGASKSAVSRRFVEATSAELKSWLTRDLAVLDIAALLIDGIVVGEHVVLVALGIDAKGRKHVLGLREGATENATACSELLGDLIGRGLPADQSLLVVIDGSKALAKAVRQVFGARALIQRCQVHKKRNVLDQLPDRMRESVSRALSEAWASRLVARARRLMTNLAKRLEVDHPGAAASLREGLEETLTVMRLQVPELLARSLVSTNAIEHLNSVIRRVGRNVTRWRGGRMVLRWVAVSLLEAERGFHRLEGYASMPALVAALKANDARVRAVGNAA